jgi:pimeloyl-ACP methyl ester carboxylesterase
MQGTATSFDRLPVRYQVQGESAAALVLVHGWSCDRSYWRATLDPFADRYRVVAVDLGGHGESGVQRSTWSMPAFGADVAAVVQALELSRLVLVGHSMGGDVAVEAARQLPGRVAGLVWVDTYRNLADAEPDLARLERFIAPFRADFVTATRGFARRLFGPEASGELIEQVATDMSSAPPEIALNAMWHAFSHQQAAVTGVGELALPTVAINPDNGRTDIDSLARFGVHAVLMPGVGHFPMLEDPDGFNRLLAGVVQPWLD